MKTETITITKIEDLKVGDRFTHNGMVVSEIEGGCFRVPGNNEWFHFPYFKNLTVEREIKPEIVSGEVYCEIEVTNESFNGYTTNDGGNLHTFLEKYPLPTGTILQVIVKKESQ